MRYLNIITAIPSLICSVRSHSLIHDKELSGTHLQNGNTTEVKRRMNWSDTPVYTLKRSDETISDLSFYPDGKRLASATSGANVDIWNVENGEMILTLPTPDGGRVTSVAVSPKLTLLASATIQNIFIWNLENNGTDFTTLTNHTNRITSVTFSPDGTKLASTSIDKTIIIWDIENNFDFVELDSGTTQHTCATFSPDGKRLATGGGDTIIRLWDMENVGAPIMLVDNANGVITSLSFSPDGNTLASGSQSGSIQLWNLNNNSLIWKGNINKNDSFFKVNSVLLDPVHNILVSGSSDLTVRVWDLEDLANPTVSDTFRKHTDPVSDVAMSPNAVTMATAARNTIIIWEFIEPSLAPSSQPSTSLAPSNVPSNRPSLSKEPTVKPSDQPSTSSEPTLTASDQPSLTSTLEAESEGISTTTLAVVLSLSGVALILFVVLLVHKRRNNGDLEIRAKA